MMTRPKILTLVSLIFLLSSASLPVQIFFLYGHTLTEWPMVVAKLSVLNWAVIILGAVNFFLVWRASPLSRWSVPALAAAVIWNNLVVGFAGTDFELSTTLLASGGFLLVCGFLLHPEIRELLSKPHRRWWLRPSRVQAHIPIAINPHLGVPLKASTFDLSESGAFIPLAETAVVRTNGTSASVKLKKGDLLTISMKIGIFRKIRCDAVVVRTADACGQYPAGYGIQFTQIGWNDRKHLKRYVHAATKEKATASPSLSA